MQFVINLCFLCWSLFLQLLLSREACDVQPAPSPSRSFGEPADACWGSSRPPLRGFYLHTPFLADRFQISQHDVFHPTNCSARLRHLRHYPAPQPLCVGTNPRVLLPSGSPAIATRQRLAEERWRWVVGQGLGRFLLGGWDGCLSPPGEVDKPFELPPHMLKSTGANTQNPPTCKAQGGGSCGSGKVGTLPGDAPEELLCCTGMGPLHAALPGHHICWIARTLHRKHVLVPVAIRKYKETCFQRCVVTA